MKSEQLAQVIERVYPKASRKEFRLAAFSAMIDIIEKNPNEAVDLQDLVLTGGAGPSME